ncbi:MAG TPA: hypothetical protein VF622_02600, partial [Segetibacter sp.]
MWYRYLILFYLVAKSAAPLNAQTSGVFKDSISIARVSDDSVFIINSIDFDINKKAWLLSFIVQCVHKGDTLISIFPRTSAASIKAASTSKFSFEPPQLIAKAPLIKLHGNILYDLNYRSFIDTPYAEKDVYQHTIQTYLDATIKDKYPLRIYFTTRFSNSNLFRNLTDLNLEFNPDEFTHKIKEQLKAQLAPVLTLDSLMALKKLLDVKVEDLLQLQSWIKNPANIQRLIEEREKFLLRTKEILPGISVAQKDTFIANLMHLGDTLLSTQTKFANEYEKKRLYIDSLKQEVSKLQKLYSAGKENLKTNTSFLKSEIDRLTSFKTLQSHLTSFGLSDSALPKGYKFLLGLRSFKIGRSLVNYSELSAKNISITGIQVEYKTNNYYAFAAGIVDYRFRDFIVANRNAPTQYLNLFRAGKGLKGGNNIILTYYNGRRQLYNSSTTIRGQQIPNYQLFGFTVEGQLQINRSSFIVAELAKSSIPYYSLQNPNRQKIFSSIWKMDDRSNEAYSIKIGTYIPSTKTRVNGYYKHFGSNFQSFSLFTSGSAQSSWSAKVEQQLIKKHLFITGSIRANDFTNPFIDRGYSSTTVFKSIQASLRLRKFPVISVGYYPSSQLTKLNEAHFIENLFYTLTASGNHFYKIKDIQFNSSIVYTQFYNRAADSNFVYFNTKNLFLSQLLTLNKFSVQSNITLTDNTEYSLYTLEQTMQYSINKWLRIGAGVKYNKQTIYERELVGYSANGLLKVPKIGEFQFNVD